MGGGGGGRKTCALALEERSGERGMGGGDGGETRSMNDGGRKDSDRRLMLEDGYLGCTMCWDGVDQWKKDV
jgi:hypothetical protein